jgi:hypothetical protein
MGAVTRIQVHRLRWKAARLGQAQDRFLWDATRFPDVLSHRRQADTRMAGQGDRSLEKLSETVTEGDWAKEGGSKRQDPASSMAVAMLGSALSIRNARIVGIGEARALGRRRARSTWEDERSSPVCSMRMCTTREPELIPGTRHAASNERSRSLSCRRRSRRARASVPPAHSSRALAAGITRNWPRIDGRQRRSSMQLRRSTASYISGTGGGTGAITNSVGSAFLTARGVDGG